MQPGHIYAQILSAKTQGLKLLAILLDPDKIATGDLPAIISGINASPATHIFVGGSEVTSSFTQLIDHVKKRCPLPVVLFPGNPSQIVPSADGILFLSLLSGRNPDFLIGHQVSAVPALKKTRLEIIPTGYLLIESGGTSAVSRVTGTLPMPLSDPEKIVRTAQAGEMLGMKLMYLEAGSGAPNAVPCEVIRSVSKATDIPLIVGGGIRSAAGIEAAYAAGADLVVIGTAFETDPSFFERQAMEKNADHV